jgi:hypothetical protein
MRIWLIIILIIVIINSVYALELIGTVQVAQNPSGSYGCNQKNNIYPVGNNFVNYPVFVFSSSYNAFPTIQERSFSGGMADVTFSSGDPNYVNLINYFGSNSPRIMDYCLNDELYKAECGNYWNYYQNLVVSPGVGGLVKIELGEVVSNPVEWRCEDWISTLNGNVVKQPGFFAPKIENVSYSEPGNPGPMLGSVFYGCYVPNCVINVSARAQQGRVIDKIIVQGPAPGNVVQNTEYCNPGNMCSTLFNIPFSSYGGPQNNTYFITAVDDLNISGTISVGV